MIEHYSEDADTTLEKTCELKMEQMKSLPIMKANWDKFLWATQMQYEDTVVVIVNAREQMSKIIKNRRPMYRSAYIEAEADFLKTHKRSEMKVGSIKKVAEAKVQELDDQVEDLKATIKQGEDLRDALQERIRSIKVIARVEHRDL